ncbi:MAG TPA: nucleotidyltransferase domain-containing protein [Rubrobacter sp.]|nr:nucleotidyltransferase domain-containing protein [Rubrobacter sp.]
MVTEERAAEVGRLLERVRVWAAGRPDVAAVGLAGSWARGEAGMDSDVDLAVLSTEQRRYLEDDGWVLDLGGPTSSRRNGGDR